MRTMIKRTIATILTICVLFTLIPSFSSLVYATETKGAPDSSESTLLKNFCSLVGGKIIDVSGRDCVAISNDILTVSDLISMVGSDISITVFDAKGNELQKDSNITTGSSVKLQAADNTAEADFVIYGDVNGDGQINKDDAEIIKCHIMEEEIEIGDLNLTACDANEDGEITALDYVRVMNFTVYSQTKYTLHFELSGIEDIEVKYGRPVTLPAPTQENNEFAGWYIKEIDVFIEGNKVSQWHYVSEETVLTLLPIFTSAKAVAEGMTITAGENSIDFSLGKLGTEGNVYFIYAINAAEYYYTETETGQFRNETDSFEAGKRQNVVESGELLGLYLGGSDYSFSINRYSDDGYDYIYKKYYVVNGDDVAKGPVWVTEFTSQKECNDYAYAASALLPDFNPLADDARNKKGVCGALSVEQTEYYGDAYIPIGMPLIAAVKDENGAYKTAGIIAPNEIVNEETGEITYRGYEYYHDKSIPAGAGEVDENGNLKDVFEYPYIEIQSNGTYYYIDRAVLSVLDAGVSSAYHCNMYSIGIMTVNMYKDQEVLPYYMQYPGMEEFVTNKTDPKANAMFQQVNTANQIGANYWIALMEFFAWRYAPLGLIDIILGNETDFAGAWNVTADYTTTNVTVDQYSEELYRAVRLASLAFKNYTDDLDMSLSFTHYWAWNGAEGGLYTYRPYEIVERMLAKSNEQGNFNWGLTVHDYAYNLAANNIFNGDVNSKMVSGDFTTTKCITITNLEVLEQYLEQDYARYNGKLRHVYLTETGINTGKDDTDAQQRRQAAGIIYHYYKVQMLDAIVCWPYYHIVDNPAEKIFFGLFSDASRPRLSNEVWKDLGKLSIEEINEKYRDYLSAGISLFDENDDYATILQKMADELGVDYDWNAAWEKYYGYSVRTNKFTTAPAAIETPYTGKAITIDSVKAYKGTVQYKYFDSERKPIDQIVEAGNYFYVAYVTETDKYEGLESNYVSLTVTKADNALIYPVVDGKIYLSEAEESIVLPEEITLFGAPHYTVKDSKGNEVTELKAGTYTLVVDSVPATDNYAGLEGGTYIIEVTPPTDISTYEELVAALNDYYSNPISSKVLNLVADIDCGNKVWNVDSHGVAFGVTFNGNGHTISNLKMGKIGDSSIGFFDKIGDGAVIKNLTIKGVNIALEYPEDDTAYTAPVSIGILGAKVTGTKVSVSGVTVSNVNIAVTNRSAKDHQIEIGGMFGTDHYTTASDEAKYLRSKLNVKNLNVTIEENAENVWCGGYAGTLEGAAPSASADESKVVYSACVISGGKMTMYNPAGEENACMGAYIGRLNNYTDITMKDKCAADIGMVRYDARVTALMGGGLVESAMPDPMATGNYGRFMPSNYFFLYSGKKNTLGWFGMQTNITGKYYEAAPESATVDGVTYARSSFNIGSKCTCTSEMSIESYEEQNITLTDEQLRNGYVLNDSSIYIGDTKTDITYFRADNIRVVGFANNWKADISNYNLAKTGVMYAPTKNILGNGAANCMGYWYYPEWPAGNGDLGWCVPYEPSGAAYFDAVGEGYTVSTLTEEDFAKFDKITLYGLVTAKNGDQCWYKVIKLNVSVENPKHNTEAILFLGDSVCSSAQYVADVKGVRDNYVYNPYEMNNSVSGGWTHSGGWAYQYAEHHPETMVYNYGVGGATMGDFGLAEGSTLPEEYASFRAAHPEADVKTVVIEMTLNDLLLTDTTQAAYGGSVASLTDFNLPIADNLKTTTLGAAVNLVHNIRADYPDAEIIFLTPPERYDEMYTGNYMAYIPQVFTDLETICRAMQLPVIDFWGKSGLQCSLDDGASWNAAYYSEREGVHPGLAGYYFYIYPCMSKYMDEGDDSVLLFNCDWITKEENSFTKAPQPMSATYTGSEIVFEPGAEASYGTVTYKYFDMQGNELESITDAGSYQYKAYVKGDITHKALESDFVAITVNKADNAFTTLPQAVTATYTGSAIAVVSDAAAANGTVTYKYYNAQKTEIAQSDIVNVGTYYYKAIVGESPNYNKIESDFVEITVEKRANSFTAEAQPITVTYTGSAAVLKPSASAQYGTVTFTYFNSEKAEINKADIVNAGTYYFKAQVAESASETALSSDFITITVQQAANGLAFAMENGIIEIAYVNGGEIPQFVLFGEPAVTITEEGETTPLGANGKLSMNTNYALVIGAVAETANYAGFAGGTYTLRVLGERAENAFTTAPSAITKAYDGTSNGIAPNAVAKFGSVEYTFFNSEKEEINKADIVNAGTYYYKASVAQSNTYEGLESDFIAITVNKADNSLLADWSADAEGVISKAYAADGYTLPDALTTLTAGLSFTVKNAAGEEVSKLTMGDYTLTFTGTENYNGISENYTIHVDENVTISNYEELVAALTNYYANPSDSAVLTLAADITCTSEWTLLGDNTFTATFDGASHKITGMNVTDGSQTSIGLFPKLGDGAEIKNLTIAKAKIALNYAEGDTTYAGPVSIGVMAGEVVGTKVKVSGVSVSDPTITVNNLSATDHMMQIGGAFGADHYTTAADKESYLRKSIVVSGLNATVSENAKQIYMGGISGTINGATAAKGADGDSLVEYDSCVVNKSGKGKLELYDPAGTLERGMGAYAGCLNNYSAITLTNCVSKIPLNLIDAHITVGVGSEFNDWIMPELLPAYVNFSSYYPSCFNPDGAFTNLGWIGLQKGCENRYWEPTVSKNGYAVSDLTVNGSTCGSKLSTMPCTTAATITLTPEDLEGGYQLEKHSNYIGSLKTDVEYFRAPYVADVPVPAVWDCSTHAQTNLMAKAPVFNGLGVGYWYMPGNAGYQVGWVNLHGGVIYFDPTNPTFNMATTVLTEDDFADSDTIKLYGYVTLDPNDENQQVWGYHAVTELTVKLNKQDNSFTTDPQPMTATYTGSAITFTPTATATSGTVTYKYYDDQKQEVSSIVNVGNYYYKAFVAANAAYKALESDYVAITVNKAANEFTTAPQAVNATYTGAAVNVTSDAAAKFGQITYQYFNAEKEEIAKTDIVNVGSYYYKAVVAETANYDGLESGYTAITVGKRDNSFTVEAQPITVTYTGSAATLNPSASAKYGSVAYTYFNSEKAEINKTDIVNAGTYYFKAAVAESATEKALSSDFVAITVQQAENGLLIAENDGKMQIAYVNDGEIPSFVKYGDPTITLTKKGESTPIGSSDKLEPNTNYTLVIGAVAETANYTGFAGGTYTLSVTGDRAANSFTTAPSEITKTYDGTSNGIAPNAVAEHGTVTYTYYAADKATEIAVTDIVKAGTYYYKASVAQTNVYEGVTSDFVAITVNKAANALVTGWSAEEGVIVKGYVNGGYGVPEALTTKTAGITFTLKDADGNAVTKLTMGDYTLTFTGTENYTGLSESYTVRVGISTYSELVAALTDHYAAPANLPLLKLVADIDCEGQEWTLIGDKTFTGTFDGNGKTISNLKITNNSEKIIGLLPQLGSGACVKNLTINDAKINLVYPEGTTPSGNYTVGILAGKVMATDVSVSDVTINNGSIVIDNESATDHQMEVGGVFGVDRYTTQADSSKYLRKNIAVNNLSIDAIENAQKVFIGGIAGSLLGNKATKDANSIVVYENCDVTGGELKLYDPLGGNTRVLGAYAGRLNKYTSITMKDCAADIALTMVDARVVVTSPSGLTDWVMPDTVYAPSYASYLPSNFNPTGTFDYLGWFGMQASLANRYWETTTSTAKNVVSDIAVENSSCTSVMSAQPVVKKTLEISRSELAGGYALPIKSTYVKDVQTDILYFREGFMKGYEVTSGFNCATKQLVNSSYLSPMTGTFFGADEYQISFWYYPAPGAVGDVLLGWNLFHGVGGTIYFDPAASNFNFATTTLTEADFAGGNTIKLYGITTVKMTEVADINDSSNWGWKQVIELTVTLTD